MKNFIAIFRRYTIAMVMNFAGLVLAFTAFMALMIQVGYQQSFDRIHPTSGRIYRVDKIGVDKDDIFRNVLPRGYADDIIGSSPHIVAGTVSCPFLEEDIIYAYMEGNGKPVPFKYGSDLIYPEMFDVFGVEFTEGNADALKDFSMVAIPQSLARKLFGDESALGKILLKDNLFWNSENTGKLSVGAVYKDFPANSQMRNHIYGNVGNFHKGSYGGANFVCYLLLDSPDNKSLVEDNFNKNFNYGEESGWLTDIELTPVEDIYFGDEGSAIYRNGSRSQMWLLVCISILVMVIGGINYSTFFTALAPMRVKSVNTQKILGSPIFKLRMNLITEAVLFCILAFAVSLGIIGYVSQWLYSQGLLELSFKFDEQIPLVLLSTGIAVFIGVCAGVYPSFYVTSLPPAFALKGNWAFSLSGRKFRTTMLAVQYIISFVLLVFALSVYRQNGYMISFDHGFDKDQVLVAQLSERHVSGKSDWIRERLRMLPEVEDVAYALECIGGSDTYSVTSLDLNGVETRVFTVYCTYNFLDVMGIPVVDGRNFTESDNFTTAGCAIMNQKVKDLGGELNEVIAGQSGPVRINSMRNESAPLLYILLPRGYVAMDYMYIRLHSAKNKEEVIEKIKAALAEMDPDYPFEIKQYDEILGGLYNTEIRQGKIISLFSLLAAALSLIGVFGQVLLDVHYRRRDIAVRRVYGAGTAGLVTSGLGRYFMLVGLSFIAASPIAWHLINGWQESFVERSGISLIIFAIAFIAVQTLTMAIVAFQYWRASTLDPADFLQKE